MTVAGTAARTAHADRTDHAHRAPDTGTGPGGGLDPAAPVSAGRGRWRMVGRRLLVAVPLLVAASLGVFALAAASPFDPLTTYLGSRYQNASDATRAAMSDAYGLDDSWLSAWWTWVSDLFRGDLGTSMLYRQPVTTVIADRLPWTVLLSGTALVLAAAAAIVLGLLAGTRPGSIPDKVVRGLGMIVAAVPPFVFALIGVALFAVGLHAAPVGGVSAPGAAPTAGSVAAHLWLPAIVLAVTQLPWMVLAVREAAAAAVVSDAVAGARARGIAPGTIRRRHVLPVSLAPLVTIIGARLPELIVGAVLVETVFSWPGIGEAVVESAKAMDFPLLAALTLGTTAVVLAGSLLADLAYTWLDPRVTDDQ